MKSFDMKVDIVIPNYNGSHLIQKSLSSVISSIEKYNGKVIIVDDGSEKEDRDNLRVITGSYDQVILHEHKKNRGFSSAVNTGVSLSDAEYVVLLNSDVVPSENFLHHPLQLLESDDRLFAVGCMDKSVEGKDTVLRGRGIAKWEKGMVVHSRGEVNAEDTFWVSGGSGIFKKKIYEDLGGMDEIYNPFYWEDIDLSYRAQKNGLKVLFDRNSIVTHYHDRGAIKTNYTKETITTTAYRNQFIFIWKNITSKKMLFEHMLYLSIHVFSSISAGDLNLLKGIFLAISRLPAIIKKRKFQRKYIKISDEELF